MKKVITFLFFFFISIGIILAQNFDWARIIPTTGYAEYKDIEIDDDGNILTLGVISHSTETNNGFLRITGEINFFCAKYNPEGELLWWNPITGGNVVATDLEIDIDGNIIIAGHFTNALEIGSTTINGGDGVNMFLAKLNSTGDFIWIKHSTNTGDINVHIKGITSDSNGDIVLVGNTTQYLNPTSAIVTFDNISITNNGSYDVLILKYKKNGNLLWVKTAGDNALDQAFDVSVDDQNNIYATGSFQQQLIFEETDTLLCSTIVNDAFIVKYSPEGNLLWSKQTNTSFQARGDVIEVNEGHLYLTGIFTDDFELGGEIFTTPDVDVFYTFLCKMDTLGNVLYLKPYVNSVKSSVTRATDMDFDENGNPYIIGYYGNEGITDDGVVMNNLGHFDLMLTKHNKTTGDILNLWNGGGEFQDYGECIGVKNAGEIYIGGKTSSLDFIFHETFQESRIFISESNPELHQSGFLIKLSDNVFNPELSNEIVTYPNPVKDILIIDVGKKRETIFIQVYDAVGKKISESNFQNQQIIKLHTNKWVKGIYFLETKIGNEFTTIKIMK